MGDTPFHDKDGLSSPSVVSSDSIEMSNFDEITVTPNPRNNYRPPYIVDHDDDDVEEGEDEDRTALLNSGERFHSVQRLPDHTNRLWPQVKRIVLEVGYTVCVIRHIIYSPSDSTHSACHHSRAPVYWRDSEQRLGVCECNATMT